MKLDLARSGARPAPEDKGKMVTYKRARTSPPDMSFLEMLDVLNERLTLEGEEPIAFDHDCREGICGMCGMVINGVAHGPEKATTTCQLHMRHFSDGDDHRRRAVAGARRSRSSRTWSSTAARSTRSSQAGGYISAPTGAAPDAHAIPVPKADADSAFEAAACIGCGACVAACPNGSAMLFTAAKITHLGLLPQGQPERDTARRRHGRRARRGRVRRLHQHRRVHRGLPEGHPAGDHRPAQPRLPRRQPPQRLNPGAPVAPPPPAPNPRKAPRGGNGALWRVQRLHKALSCRRRHGTMARRRPGLSGLPGRGLLRCTLSQPAAAASPP